MAHYMKFALIMACLAIASCDQGNSEELGEEDLSEIQLGLAEIPEIDPQLAAPRPAPPPLPQELSEKQRQDLLSAMAKAELFKQVLRQKERSGRVVAPGQESNLKKAEQDLETMRQKLALLSEHGTPTYALIHGLNASGILRTWLIGPEGGIVSGFYDRLYDGLGAMTNGLGVDALASTRAPRPEGKPPASRAAVRAAIARDQSSEAVQLRAETLTETADIVFPGAVGDALGSRSGRLLVIGARDTGTAPYAALPLKNGPAVENWSFVILPDIGTLTEAEGFFDFAALDIDQAVIIGDPDLSSDTEYDWDELKGARLEAVFAEQQFSDPATRLFLGADATKRNFVAAINANPDAGVIYMATHAIANPRLPLTRGFVAMANERYYASHIMQTKFKGWDENEPLVIVSACQTALGRYLDGGGFGVARTWTVAGAGQVVASLWNVSDKATYILMTNFVMGLKKGMPPETAMQRAQIRTMNYTDRDGNKVYLNDPKMWASFSIYGKPTIDLRPQG